MAIVPESANRNEVAKGCCRQGSNLIQGVAATTDESESREPSERSANHTSRGLVIFVVVLMCYVLSPIPIFWGLWKLGVLDRVENAFTTFYAPLTYLADNIEFVGKFYRWQLSLFGR